MRRTRLIWFACGTALSALVFSGSQLLLSGTEQTTQIALVVLAPDIVPAGSELDDLDSLSLTTGSTIRDCGNDEFAMQLSPHHGIAYEIPVTAENREGLDCVVQSLRSMDEAVSISFEVR